MITSDQMAVVDAKYESFKIEAGELWAPYATTPELEELNLTVLYGYGRDVFPSGLLAFMQIGAYELSFNACVAAGTLSRDPNWLSRSEVRARAKETFERLFNSLPSATSKKVYFNQHNGLLTGEQQTALEELGGAAAFKSFMDEGV
jgi:hypothetical protein